MVSQFIPSVALKKKEKKENWVLYGCCIARVEIETTNRLECWLYCKLLLYKMNSEFELFFPGQQKGLK